MGTLEVPFRGRCVLHWLPMDTHARALTRSLPCKPREPCGPCGPRQYPAHTHATCVCARVSVSEQRVCARACMNTNNVCARARACMRTTCMRARVCICELRVCVCVCVSTSAGAPCCSERTLAPASVRAARAARAARAVCMAVRVCSLAYTDARVHNTRVNRTYARNVCMRARECKRTMCVRARVHECEQRMCTRRYTYAHAYT